MLEKQYQSNVVTTDLWMYKGNRKQTTDKFTYWTTMSWAVAQNTSYVHSHLWHFYYDKTFLLQVIKQLVPRAYEQSVRGGYAQLKRKKMQ